MTTATRCNTTYWYRYLQLIFAIAVVMAIRGVLKNDEVDSVEVSGILKQKKQSTNFKQIPWNCTNKGDCNKKASTCHSTKITPFRAGCPAKCPNQDDALSSGPFYRLYMAWYFGQPQAYRNVSYPKHYDKGVNFQCPGVVMDHFGRASQLLRNRFQADLSTSKTNLVIKKQQAMHISLSYLCCLRKDQASKTVQLMKEWVQARDFDFRVRFDRLECWLEHPNSVTNILIVDEKSQQTLMGYLRDFERYLESHGIPVVVPRTDQMPFHTTILGVQYNKVKDESDDPVDDMAPWLPKIHSIVNDVDQSSEFRGPAWTGGKTLRITHRPYFSLNGTLHA